MTTLSKVILNRNWEIMLVGHNHFYLLLPYNLNQKKIWQKQKENEYSDLFL